MAHWQNSRFQIQHFLAGQCHTADEMYRVLRQQREDRVVAVANANAVNLRAEAKILRAKEIIAANINAIDVLEARADLAEIEAVAEQSKAVYDVAVKDVEFYDTLIAKLTPMRKYADLSDEESDQLCQQEEWGLRFAHRARLFLFSQGTIPQDQLESMLSHPDFKTVIAPEIKKVTDAMASGKLSFDVLERPKLLGGPDGL